jgi:hypothetical protein
MKSANCTANDCIISVFWMAVLIYEFAAIAPVCEKVHR